jgi:hypothetical protein
MHIPGSKRENFTRLPHTGVWVPRSEAYDLAFDVYRDFSGNPRLSEKLARLSFVAQSNFDPDVLNAYLDGEQRRILNINHYAVEPIHKVARDNLARTAMVANMIVPDIDGDEVSGHIQEPFSDRSILDDLYFEKHNGWNRANFKAKVKANRLKASIEASR